MLGIETKTFSNWMCCLASNVRIGFHKSSAASDIHNIIQMADRRTTWTKRQSNNNNNEKNCARGTKREKTRKIPKQIKWLCALARMLGNIST